MRTIETVERLVSQTIADMGYELCDVEFQKEQGNWVLTLYINKEGGVTLDDCEAVSRAVDPVLDEADPIEQAYYLSVSSLGIDRPLKRDADFERNMGKKLVVRLYAAVNGSKQITGSLLAFDAHTVTLKLDDGSEAQIMRKDAAKIEPYIEW